MEYRIDEFRELVHPRDGHRKVFVMLEAYLDESGIHDGAVVCVVAGYFAGHGQWKRFEIAWRKLLRDFHVPLEKFHAKDLFPKLSGFFLHHWDSRQRHEEFLQAIAHTIASQKKVHPLGFSVNVADFESYPEEVRRYFTGADMGKRPVTTGCPNKPYFLPFQFCVVRVCDYAPVGGKAHFFFGIDRPFYGYATELFKRMENGDVLVTADDWKRRIGMPAFPKAAETPQLQAADFLCHLMYHHMLNAGPNAGKVWLPPLLATCVKNIRHITDFQFFVNASLYDLIKNGAALSLARKQQTPGAIA